MYLGIDLGTSGVKVLLLTKEGEVIKTKTENYKLFIPKEGWSEQNPNDWFEATIKALKNVIVGYEKDIKALSFSGQMHGLVLLDKNDNVIRNALLWNDQRTIKEVDYLNKDIGKEKLISETGNIAVTGLTLPKLLWVKNNEKENYEKIDKVMLPKDYLSYKFTNEFATDKSDVSGTLYYDVENQTYSNYMIGLTGLKLDNFPKVYSSFDVVGLLNEELKNKLNIKQDVKVIIGGGDQAVGAIGVGIVEEGICNISLGTSGVVFTSMNKFKDDKETNMQSYVQANDNYHMMGVMLNAAGSLKWWMENVLESNNYDKFFDSIKDIKVEDTLYFLPYLTGERAPINDPLARGTFIGIRPEHKKDDLGRALVEGITFNLDSIFNNIKNKGIPITKARVIGGGAKSDIWVQMISDIFNIEVETIKIEEGPALGAAILAMVGDGAYKDLLEATKQIVKINQTFVPNQEKSEIYLRKKAKYNKVYFAIKDAFRI